MDGSGRDCEFEAGETARSDWKIVFDDSFRVRHRDEFPKLLRGGVVAEDNPGDCRQHKHCDPDCSPWLGASPDELEHRTGAGAAAAALFPATASPVPAPGVVTGCPHLRQNCDSSGSSVLHLLQDRAIAEGTPAVT